MYLHKFWRALHRSEISRALHPSPRMYYVGINSSLPSQFSMCFQLSYTY